MKIFFMMRHPFFLKNFAVGISILRSRGHDVRVFFTEAANGRVGEHLADESVTGLTGLESTFLPPPDSAETRLVRLVAGTLDVLRYDDPAYDDAPALRSRARVKLTKVPLVEEAIKYARRAQRRIGFERTNAMLRGILAAVPPDPALLRFLKDEKPDLMMVSPLTPLYSEQAAYLTAAKVAGVRTMYVMYSWDNLSNKGLIRPEPDAALVWNPLHKEEAATMHGLAEEKIHYVGAPGFDIWFSLRPTLSKEEFCRKVGLSPAHPYVLYTCSSSFIGGKTELPFVLEWLRALRSHPDPATAALGVMIRPHPQFAKHWETADLSKFENVVVYPRSGAIPFGGDAQTDYFHAIHHSVGIVGINTSAMVEAAIINRPVMTIEEPRFAHTQEGTLHYRHLLQFGFLLRTDSIEANIDLLSRYVRCDEEATRISVEGNTRFVEGYLRPLGADRPAAPVWADVVEMEARKGAEAPPAPVRVVDMPFIVRLGLLLCRIHPQMGASPFATKKLKRYKKALSEYKKKIFGAARQVAGRSGSRKGRAPEIERRGKKRRPLRIRILDRLARTIGLYYDPLSPKSHNKLSGPYRLLVSLDAEYAGAGAAAPVLVFGDSVHQRVSWNDKDHRTLATMLEEEARPDFRMLCLNFSAYHPAVYAGFMRALGEMPLRPRVAVFPINLRCFSPQWAKNPQLEYSEEIAVLDGYRLGEPIRGIDRTADPKARERFDAVEVEGSTGGDLFDTMAGYNLVSKARPETVAQEMWRSRLLASLYYMRPLASDHFRLRDAQRMVSDAAKAGVRPIVYLTPINHMWGTTVAGPEFVEAIRSNTAVIRERLLPGIQAAGGAFADWSLDFANDQFFNPSEKTEHLNEEGRLNLARRILDLVKSCEMRPKPEAADTVEVAGV
jgi:hypothetical protein